MIRVRLKSLKKFFESIARMTVYAGASEMTI
jgi:hypothetical protein